MSISDSDKTAKKAAETTETEPTTSEPGAERAAAKREMLSALERAAMAAGRLRKLEAEERAREPSPERDDEPPSEPKYTKQLPPPFAITSNGQLLLNVEACPELNLEGRSIFRGIVLSVEETAYALRKIEDIIHDAAGHLGGMMTRREIKESGSDDNDT